MNHYYWHYGWGEGLWMFIGMTLFWLLIIVVLYLAVRRGGWAGGFTDRRTGRERALDILRERYARGEITKEQYDQMKKDIEG